MWEYVLPAIDALQLIREGVENHGQFQTQQLKRLIGEGTPVDGF